MAAAYLTDPACHGHRVPEGHPETAARLAAIQDRLVAAGIFDLLRHPTVRPAPLTALRRAHDPDYLARIEGLSRGDEPTAVELDTWVGAGTWAAVLHAAGAAVQAVDLVLTSAVRTAFCAIRPPGHHAGRAAAGGFCLVNHAACACLHALEVHGLKRVVILDFDVHYCNGTVDILAADRRVMICSCHQAGLFPWRDDTLTAHQGIDVALPPLRYRRHLRDAVVDRWMPRLDAFAPELVIVSAGFDAHVEDEQSYADMREEDYRWLGREIVALAERHAGGRIVSILEGGYDLSSLGRSVTEYLRVLVRAWT